MSARCRRLLSSVERGVWSVEGIWLTGAIYSSCSLVRSGMSSTAAGDTPASANRQYTRPFPFNTRRMRCTRLPNLSQVESPTTSHTITSRCRRNVLTRAFSCLAYTRDGPPSYQHLDVVLKDYAIDVPAEAPVLPALPRNHHLSIPIPLLQRRSHLFRQSIVPPHHPVTVERSHQEQGPAHGPPEPEQPFERSRQQREGVVEDSEQQQQQQQQQQQNDGRQCRVDGLEEQQQESQEQRVSEELLHKTVEEDSPAKNEEPTPATKDEPDPCAGSTKEPAGPSTSIG